jgi:SdrD B-like domain
MPSLALDDTAASKSARHAITDLSATIQSILGLVAIFLSLVTSPASEATVLVEGKPVTTAVHPGGELIAYRPVLDALMIEHSYSADTRTLKARRPYDNAVLELVLPQGVVRANGRVAGMLPNAERERPGEGWLSPNAISILSGAVGRKTADGWAFELDERLRPDTNLQLWINGKRIVPSVAPRASGSLLLIPLRPIIEALGSRVALDGNQVTVVRLQDGAVMTWNATSGLVAANKKPVGIVAGSALVDLSSLLLPKDAVAALTGTNIVLMPGSNRIEILLDDRLADNLTPSALAIDRARNTPTEVERLTFQLGSTGTNLLNVRGHSGLYAGTLRLEAPANGAWLGKYNDSTQRIDNAFRPSWASLEWQSLMGLSGILGDGISGRRELDGVSVSRWRGAGVVVPLGAGNADSLRLIAGELLSNEPTVNSTGTFYPRFGGSVIGARWYAADGGNEWGFNFKRDPIRQEGDLAVLSWNRQSRWISSLVSGMSTSFYSDLHVANLERELGGLGGRGLLSLSGTFVNGWNTNASANYTSAIMNGALFRDPDGLLRRPADTGGFDISIGGPLNAGTTAGSRAFVRRTGIEDPTTSRSRGWGANIGRHWAGVDATSTLDFSTAIGDATPEPSIANPQNPSHTEVDRLTLTLDKRWNESLWSARIEDTRSRGAIEQRLRSATVTFAASPWLFIGSKNESFSFSPLITAAWSRSQSQGTTSSNFGRNIAANFAFQSGSLLGESWRVTMNAGWSGFRNSVRDERTGTLLADLLAGNTNTLRTEQKTASTGWYFNLRSQHRLTRGLALEWGANKAQGGDTYGYLQLNGAFDFAPVQLKSLPRSGRGVVEGLVFLDENGNGIQDPNERGIPLAEVRVLSTPWSLRTNGTGNFTINNLPQGVYSVTVDLASLPLGYRIGDGEHLRFSILDQQVTDIKIPVVDAGQIRGRIFIDRNRNGRLDDGEDGAVGRTVELTGRNVKANTRTAIFGQFVFDLLPVGNYTILVDGHERKLEISTTQKFIHIDIAITE